MTGRTMMMAAVALLLGGAANAREASAQDTGPADGYEWRGTIAGGATLEIKGVNGAIVARSAPGSEVVVRTSARGRRSDPATVRIERIEHAGGITFCAVYPARDDADEENFCAPGEGGRMNTRRNDVVVDFEVQVPADVPLVARTVNGEVEATGLAAGVTAVTVNGNVVVETAGVARAQTVNGSIEARMDAGRLPDGLRFETVNGSVTLDLADDLGAEIDARWLNGSLEADLPFTASAMGRGRARGTIGGGGPLREVATVNGSIRIH